MVTTRAGSRAASETLGSPAPKRVSAKGTPRATPRGTPLKKGAASPKSPKAEDTPVTKAVKSALNPAAEAARPRTKSARRRAGQKSRLRALRAVRPVSLADVEPGLAELLTRTLRQMLDKLGRGESLCPSRVPRLLAQEEAYADWQALLPAMAAVVAEEARIGKLECVRDGEVVPAEGPVRVRRGKNF